MPLPDSSNSDNASSSTLSSPSTQFNVDLMVNQGQIAEGPTIPPIQQGQYRVPKPTGFGVQSITNSQPMGSLIVFTWNDIQSFGADIAEYRIFATLAYSQNPEPTAVGSAQQSPCYVTVVSPQATSAVFTLRPYLANGQTLPIDQCPTCTVAIPAPVFQFASGNDVVYIDANRPQSAGAGTTTSVTYNASDNFTVPVNVSLITAEIWGAGGVGGDGGPIDPGGGGGGGGGYSNNNLAVVAGDVYPLYVAVSGSGQNTWFASAAFSSFSAGCGSNGLSDGTGGAPGTGATANGTVGGTTVTSSGAAGGAAGGGGDGGQAGAGGPGGNTNAFGSVGQNGRVKISWTTSAGTNNAPGIGVTNSNGRLSSLTDQTLLFINTAGKVTAAIGTNGTGADPGFVAVYDGTAAHDVLFSPGSQTTVGAAGGATALPATPVKYANIKIGGTDFVFPVYIKS